jgi:hypothetical protein
MILSIDNGFWFCQNKASTVVAGAETDLDTLARNTLNLPPRFAHLIDCR